MSGIAVAALVLVSLWLGILTLIVILAVRQIGLITVRLASPSQPIPLSNSLVSLDDDGLTIGTSVPEGVTSILPTLKHEHTCLLVSATCVPCHELVQALHAARLASPFTVLIAGHTQLADEVAALLPTQAHIVRDPAASNIAEALGVSSVPFGIVVADGTIAKKAFLRRATDFIMLLEAQDNDETLTFTHKQQEVGDHVA